MRIDEYSESQYNNFGWVRANNVVSSSHWRDFTTKFARAKGGSKEFVKTASGEFIIPVNDMTGKGFGVDNVLIYAKGSIDSPKISKIVKINLNNETDIDVVRRYIYEREQRSGTWTGSVTSNLYESGLVREYRGKDFRDYQSYKAEIGKRSGRSESGRTNGNNQHTQNGSGNTGSDTRYALRPTKYIENRFTFLPSRYDIRHSYGRVRVRKHGKKSCIFCVKLACAATTKSIRPIYMKDNISIFMYASISQ